MKKRLFGLALSTVLCISAAGCGALPGNLQEKLEEAGEKIAEAVSELERETEQKVLPSDLDIPEPERETEETPEPVKADTGDIPQGLIMQYYASDYDSEKMFTFATSEIHGVMLAEESREAYPALYDALEKDWNEDYDQAKKTFDDMSEGARMEYSDLLGSDEDTSYVRSYTSNSNAWVTRSDPKVFSVCRSFYEDMGGAHGNYGNMGRTYDASTGERLALSDVIADLSAFGETLFERVEEEYPDIETYLDSMDEMKDQILEEVQGDPETWALEPDGIVYYFNPYDIAAYAAGEQIIKIGYQEKPELFNEAYLPVEGMDYIGGGTSEYDLRIDLDGDGKSEHIYLNQVVEVVEDGDYTMTTGLNADVNNGEKTISLRDDEWEFFGFQTDVARFANGKTYLIISFSELNDYRTVSVYEAADGDLKKVEEYGFHSLTTRYDDTTESYGTYAMNDTNRLYLTEHFDRLSTYQAGGIYYMTDDGKIQTDDVYAVIPEESREYLVITSKVDLTVDIVDEEGTVLEKDVTIEAGTDFPFYRTPFNPVDGRMFVDFLMNDGRIARLYYEDNEVCGIEEWDAFEMLLYAG